MKKVKLFIFLVTALSVLLAIGASAASNLTEDYSVTVPGKTTSSAILEYDKGTKILGILFSPAKATTTVEVPKTDVGKISFFSMGHSIANWNTYASNSASASTCDTDGVTSVSCTLSGNQYATNISHTATVSYNGVQDINYSDNPVQ